MRRRRRWQSPRPPAASSASAAATARAPIPTVDPVRRCSLALADALGLPVSPGLPIRGPGTVRPVQEIALRVVALKTLVTFVLAPPTVVANTAIQAIAERLRLRRWLAEDERTILTRPRAQVQDSERDHIGWKLENLAALCWCLGCDGVLDEAIAPLDGDASVTVFTRQTPALDDAERWLAAAALRPLAEIAAREDAYYCLHHAARTCDLASSWPGGLESAVHGRVIQERRWALTWALSPGVAWADTDQST